MRTAVEVGKNFEVLALETREPTRDYALRCISYNISCLNLLPGDYVSEAKISEVLGISRTPVREAFFDLSNLGIIEIFPQKGSRVSLINVEMVEQARFMRWAIERCLIQFLSQSATGEDISILESLVEKQEEKAKEGDLKSFLLLDNEFHRHFSIIQKKELVYSVVKKLMVHFDRVRMLNLVDMDPFRSIEEHKNLIAALRGHDEKKALSVIDVHLGHVTQDIIYIREKNPEFFV